jgi:2-C-methyl-D-erythritol 2,4-cyclodiphosphate synthase
MRIGIGYDSHRLVAGRRLIIGGVDIPHEKGLLGHSDADALLHAICDAILGAIGAGDIGRRFPDTDPRYKDISSLKLLTDVRTMAEEKGYRLSNIDATIILERPKLLGHIGLMVENISRVLDLPIDRINIKAKTNEGMGFTGRGEGMAAFAVVTVKESEC